MNYVPDSLGSHQPTRMADATVLLDLQGYGLCVVVGMIRTTFRTLVQSWKALSNKTPTRRLVSNMLGRSYLSRRGRRLRFYNNPQALMFPIQFPLLVVRVVCQWIYLGHRVGCLVCTIRSAEASNFRIVGSSPSGGSEPHLNGVRIRQGVQAFLSRHCTSTGS